MELFKRSLNWVVVAVVGLTTLSLIDPTHVLRASIALAALVLPIGVLLWPRLRPHLGLLGAATLTGSASIGVLIVASIGLNLTPPGLTQLTWLTVSVAVFVIAFITRPTARVTLRPTWTTHEAFLGAAALAMVFSAFVLARTFVNVPGESFTQLWMLRATPTTPAALTIGVHSSEREATTYRLELVRAGSVINTWSLDPLEPGQTWQTRVVPRVSGRVEARLYRADSPLTVYRHVAITLPADAVQG